MKKHSKCKKKKGLIIFLVISFLTMVITLYTFSNKMLVKIGETTYVSMLSTASYYAISGSLTDKYDYEDLFIIEKNNNGDIVLISTDSYKLNNLCNELAHGVMAYLSKEINKGVEVPIGVFTGINMLAGFGKKINMPLIAINSVRCNIISKFDDAGINQTKHTLIIDIQPEVYLVTRFLNEYLTDKISVLIYENLIIGNVPEVYLAGSSFSANANK